MHIQYIHIYVCVYIYVHTYIHSYTHTQYKRVISVRLKLSDWLLITICTATKDNWLVLSCYVNSDPESDRSRLWRKPNIVQKLSMKQRAKTNTLATNLLSRLVNEAGGVWLRHCIRPPVEWEQLQLSSETFAWKSSSKDFKWLSDV